MLVLERPTQTQGTRLNGKPLPPNKPTVLKNGSELQFGQDPRRYILADIESAGGPLGLCCCCGVGRLSVEEREHHPLW
jgi:hypothetical protein